MKDKTTLPIQYDDVHKILPHSELKYYIKNFLINDNEFVNDIDLCMCNGKMMNMSLKERIQYFENNIGNEARTYIFKVLTLKHLSKILINNIDGFTDEFWKDRLNRAL